MPQNFGEDERTLYVVATPIGNLGDVTPRMREVFARVQMIAAEDTRHTGMLLQKLDIPTPRLISYHNQNEQQSGDKIVAALELGKGPVALVSDAGTPAISDPGFRVVRAARERNLPVVVIPGPSALTAAVSISGLPSDRLLFVGFLPTKDKALRSEVQSWLSMNATIVFYESPHRVLSTLRLIDELLTGSEVFVARELTKKFEESILGSTSSVVQWLLEKESIKGEFVILVKPKSQNQRMTDIELQSEIRRLLKDGFRSKDVVAMLAESGRKSKELYALIQTLKSEED